MTDEIQKKFRGSVRGKPPLGNGGKPSGARYPKPSSGGRRLLWDRPHLRQPQRVFNFCYRAPSGSSYQDELQQKRLVARLEN
jgi:hypothetical protein